MYGKTVELTENSGTNYLQPGIHKVFIKSLTVEQLTGNYNGAMAKVVVEDENGLEASESIFPYQFSDKFMVWGTQKVTPAEQQEDDYLKKIKEIFSRAMPLDKDYDALTGVATSFETLIQALQPAVRANGGLYIWQLVKADKNNYAKIAMHKGGSTQTFAEGEECRLKFDAEKFGKKEKTAEAVEVASSDETDDLPF